MLRVITKPGCGLFLSLLFWPAIPAVQAAQPFLVFEPRGHANGKNIVLVSGDEEYRSEEMLPELAKILSLRQGFRCTVLFSIDPKDGTIDPERIDNIPGLEALDSADLLVLQTRFRDLPDDQMKHVVTYLDSGKPIVGIRTATHAFLLKSSPTYARFNWNNPDGGFGGLVLGETWVNHHGRHGKQSTLGAINPKQSDHPILRGIGAGDIRSTTDVYEVHLPLPGDSTALLFGEVLSGMRPDDPPVEGAVNNPMMPIAWTKTYESASGRKARVFATTLGTAQDLVREGNRRLLVNACYWALGLERNISPHADVDLAGEYNPDAFGFGGYVKGRTPEYYSRHN